MPTFTYHPRVLDELARHGLRPLPDTPPERLRDAVRDLYRHEIRTLRRRLLAGVIEKSNYAAEVVRLRGRYGLLSLPLIRWTVG